MSQLEQVWNVCIQEHPELEDLAYCWRGKDAATTDRDFADFHRRLTRAVQNKKRDTIEKIIVEIVHTWGGINNFTGLADRYPGLLLALDEDDPVSSQSVTPLASWTKVLAAYKPERFNIYDSRVAAALRYLIPGTLWFLPPPRENRQTLFDHMGRRGQLSQKETYASYMRLLHETDDPLGYERKLFMLGGLLRWDEKRQKVALDLSKSGRHHQSTKR